MHNYQNIIVNGKEFGRASRKRSAFYNEGKWHNFILPLLPDDCSEMTFIDFGCNYGVHMKLAIEHGFKTVIGIESNDELCETTTDYLGCNNGVIYTPIDKNIFRSTFLADLPPADFVLMSNFHYHIEVPIFIHLVNMLRHKTRYAIVVSVEKARRKLYRSESGIAAVRRYFQKWEEVCCISGISPNGDPAPRKDMFSILFKTNVERVAIKDIKWGRYGKRFYDKVKRDTELLNERRPMTYPVLLRQDGSLVDGHHRLARLEIDGIESVLAEKA